MLDSTTVGRALGIALAMLGPPRALAQDRTAPARVITEADVVRLAAAAEPRIRVAARELDLARAAERGAALMDNPSLEWEREAIPGAEHEDAVSLALPLDFSGRRAARGAAARASVALAQAAARHTRSAVVTRALGAFYAALAAKEALAIAEQARAHVDEAVRVVVRRHVEGSVAGYDRLRLELEAELVRSELAQAEASLERERSVLALLLGLDAAGLELRGSLEPDAVEASVLGEVGAAGAAGAERPSRRHMAQAEGALGEAERAAGRGYIPRLELHGGVRAVSADDTRVGYLAGVSVELPFLSHGQDLAQDASARRAVVREQLAADRFATRVATADASRALAAARRELSRFGAAVGDRLERLERGALASYREGSAGIAELLEAQRARAAVARRVLELRLAARRAELALRAAQGELE